MREIKFRAWINNSKKFEAIEFIGAGQKTFPIYTKDNKYWFPMQGVLEQYTGLKDKNGVEIYEGDIVKVLDGEDVEDPYYAYLEIRYSQGKFYFHNAYAVTFDDVLDGDLLDVEVIGNIHKNKNLLVDDTDRISPDDIGNDIHEFLHGGDK